MTDFYESLSCSFRVQESEVDSSLINQCAIGRIRKSRKESSEEL